MALSGDSASSSEKLSYQTREIGQGSPREEESLSLHSKPR